MTVSIKRVLIIGVIGLQVISVSLILASSYLTSQRVLRRHAKDIMTNIATFTIHEAQNYLRPAQDAAQLTQRLANSEVVSSENRAALEQYLYDQLSLHSSFAGIYLGLPSGAFIYVNRSNAKVEGGFRTKIITFKDGRKITELIWKDASQNELIREFDPDDTYDPRTRPWYILAREKRQTIWTEPYIFFTSRQPGVTSASPVFNAAGDLTGVVGVDIDIADLSMFLSRLKVGQHGRAFIINMQGDVVAFPDLSKIKWPSERGDGRFRLTKIAELDDVLSRKAFASLQRPSDRFDIAQPLFSFFRHGQKNYHAMFAPFANPQWPWIIGIYLPEDDYLGPIKRNRLMNIYVMLGIAAVGSLIGWGIVRSVVRPMKAFQVEAQAIRMNDLDTTLDKRSVIKEIQETADSFDQMKVGLKTYMQANGDLMRDLQLHAEDLRLKEMQLRDTFTSLVNFMDALIVLDQHHAVKFLNPAAEALLGVRAHDILGHAFPFPIAQDRSAEINVDANPNAPVIAEMRVVETEWEGQAAWLVSLREVTERKRLEGEQARLLEETERLYHQAEEDAATKTVLLQEVNHRVKNNLSAIIGLLYAERRHSEVSQESLLQATLDDLINRIQGLATAHHLLSESEWRPVLLCELVEAIIDTALQAAARRQSISITVDNVPIRVSAKQASSLAIVVNEIATNTAKYAFMDRNLGSITARILQDEKTHTVLLEFRDDGAGYPDEVLTQHRFRTGLYLLHTIVRRELRGELHLYNDPGAVTAITFSLTENTEENSHA